MNYGKKIGMNFYRNILISIILLLVVFFIGIFGYIIIEKNFSFLDAVYMTAITLTTVGYSDDKITTEAGKIFTIIIIIVGIGVFAYCVSSAIAFIIEGQLTDILKRRKMEKQVEGLKKHYIICGAGDTGIHVIDELIKMKKNFVVIEQDSERLQRLLQSYEFLYIQEDATSDETLLKAGVDRATGLIASLSGDKDNLFVVLSARELNPDLRIVSKAVEEGAFQKIRKSGADDIIFSDAIGGLRMASSMIRPNVVNFLDTMLKHQDETTRFAEVTIGEGSEFIDLTLKDAKIRQRTELLVIAIRKAGGNNFIYNPKPEILLNSEDTLIVIGDINQIQKLKKLAKDPTM